MEVLPPELQDADFLVSKTLKKKSKKTVSDNISDNHSKTTIENKKMEASKPKNPDQDFAASKSFKKKSKKTASDKTSDGKSKAKAENKENSEVVSNSSNKGRMKLKNKTSKIDSESELENQKLDDIRTTDLEIEGVNYVVKAAKKKKKIDSPEKQLNAKLSANLKKQEEELTAMKLLYKEKFHVEDEDSRTYFVEFQFRGGWDAKLQFSYPPNYPSDVPPTYTLTAPWAREDKKKDISRELVYIVSENFGNCIMYKWIEKIEEELKKEIDEKKKNPEAFEDTPPVYHKPEVEEIENVPKIYEGKAIWDRNSCFSPYLASVTSEEEVRAVIDKIEDCRKVSTAWRNTYAYRYEGERGKVVEFGEDGGEPKAGGNLLKRLISYNASNVIVFISRRFGGSKLGPDRFKHLNAAADDVLVNCGYKNIPSNKSKEKNVKNKVINKLAKKK